MATNKTITGGGGGGGGAEIVDQRRLAVQIAAKTTGYTENQVYELLGTFGDTVKENLQQGLTVRLNGFGSWKPTERSARMGRDLRTKEPIQIPARTTVNFNASSGLKTAVAAAPGGGQRSRAMGGSGATASAASNPTNTAAPAAPAAASAGPPGRQKGRKA